jgi:hypothetical protein
MWTLDLFKGRQIGRLASALAASGAILGVLAGLAFAGTASIKVNVGGTKLTVSGDAGGKDGNYVQVFFDSKKCASSLYVETGRTSQSGDVIAPPDEGAFHETWSIKALLEGETPPQRYVCAYVVEKNEQGESVAAASDSGTLPLPEKKKPKHQ